MNIFHLPSYSSLFKRITVVLLTMSTIFFLFGCPGGKAETDDNEGESSTSLKVTKEDLIIGSEQAPITIVEYSDLQCPSCAHFHKVVKQTWRLIRNDVRLVVRHFPLMSIHPHAFLAAQYIEAARMQGKHELFLDELYDKQEQWSEETDAESLFLQYAAGVNLDVEKLKSDKNDPAIKDKIQKDLASGSVLEVRGTPTIFVNGKKVNFPDTPQKLFQLVQHEKQVLIDSKLNK